MNELTTQDRDLEITSELLARLRAHLRRYTGDAAVAEDLMQETLLRAMEGLARYEGRASLATWLFSIASRVAADHFRAPHRRSRIVEISECGEPADDGLPIDQRLVEREMNSCVRDVIDGLPPSCRDALLLHEFEGMTAAQVAEVLECSLATAKIRIHRARERLRAALRESCSFYRDDADTFRCDRKP